jgi:cation transport regulator ChaC
VFGYGSLVSPASLGATLGRPVLPGEGWAEAVVHDYGRRWNYGILHTEGRWTDADGIERSVTIVALGVVAATGESANGVVVAVSDRELARLDHRERHYDRVDVSELFEPVASRGPVIVGAGDRVVTYVPRPEAVDRYRAAKESGTAAIEQRYWDLVDGAFGALGPDRRVRYHATTPVPDVPVRAVRRV